MSEGSVGSGSFGSAGSSFTAQTLGLLDSFVVNMFNYFLLFLPLYLIYKLYIKYHDQVYSQLPPFVTEFLDLYSFGTKSNTSTTSSSLSSSSFTSLSVVDTNNNKLAGEQQSQENQSSNKRSGLFAFIICFLGLQISFLLWGLMQERIVKYTYGLTKNMSASEAKKAQRFKNSQFLVLTNRFAGLLLSMAILLVTNRHRSLKLNLQAYKKLFSFSHWPPLFICSYSSLSNVLSSWFQYESLKYVTFTSQLLAKSSKSIFVMLTAKVVSNKTYKAYEYFCVGLIGLGIFLFSDINNNDIHKTNRILMTTLPGFMCLFGYLVSDSFTSTWQDNLIKTYSISSISLMFITNFYSCLYTFVCLILENQWSETMDFLNEHQDITQHIVLLSITSAIGQIFIFVTIQKFGALVFSLIMTTRQVLSIVLSSIVFQHSMSAQSVFGIFLIFLALFLQQYLKFNPGVLSRFTTSSTRSRSSSRTSKDNFIA